MGTFDPQSIHPSALPLDRSTSLALAEELGVIPRHCYYFAYRALVAVPWLRGASYVEGVVCVASPLPFPFVTQHAWVEHDGVLLDPTYALIAEGATDAAWHGQDTYYPLVRYGRAEAIQAHRRAHEYPLSIAAYRRDREGHFEAHRRWAIAQREVEIRHASPEWSAALQTLTGHTQEQRA